MGDAWIAQAKNPKLSNLVLDERFAMLVEADVQTQDNRKLTKLLNNAQFRFPQACLQDVNAAPARGLEKALLRQLASRAWVRETCREREPERFLLAKLAKTRFLIPADQWSEDADLDALWDRLGTAAEKYLRTVAGRSRFAHRHAQELAEMVLGEYRRGRRDR